MLCPVCCVSTDTLINAECCLDCFRAASERPVLGEYRQSSKGLVLRVVADSQTPAAEYVYGVSSLPHISYPLDPAIGEQRFAEQQAGMWELVQQHEAAIGYWSKRLAKNLALEPSRAYDVCIDAAMRAAATMRANCDEQQQLGYMHYCCKNAAMSLARKQGVQQMEPLTDALCDDLAARPVAGRPEEEDVSKAERALQSLSGSEKHLLMAWAVEGRTQAELGDKLGVVRATIGHRLKLIREKCRESIL